MTNKIVWLLSMNDHFGNKVLRVFKDKDKATRAAIKLTKMGTQDEMAGLSYFVESWTVN